jgi:phosphoribosylglycinamide formyltransferase-1
VSVPASAVPLVAGAPFSSTRRMRVAVLASGNGSNLGALLAHAAEPGALFTVSVVIVNVDGAGAIARAASAGVPVIVEPHRAHTSRQAFDAALLGHVQAHAVDLVVLAGFMRVLTSTFLDAFPHRVMNVHPALLPAFPGLHGARQALEGGARVAGCTVHLVDAGVDTGPILAQAAVPILDDDDEHALVERIQRAEHRLLPRVVDAVARGDAVTVGGRVRVYGLGDEFWRRLAGC